MELKCKTLINTSWLKELGFTEIGADKDKWEYIIQKYCGYSDFIYYEFENKRLVIQYKCNQVELVNCTKKDTLRRALSLIGYKLKTLI